MKRIVLLGPPGSGKGTQAERLAEKLNVPKGSTGDLLRAEIRAETELGKLAKEILDKGHLVPDQQVIDITWNWVKNLDMKAGFVLDGYPRTIGQAKALDEKLLEVELPLHGVIYIKVRMEDVIERFDGRRICPACNMVYHIKYNPPLVEGKCDSCGGILIKRDDDNATVVKERFLVHEKAEKAILDYYCEQEKLIAIDGSQLIENVFSDICKSLDLN